MFLLDLIVLLEVSKMKAERKKMERVLIPPIDSFSQSGRGQYYTYHLCIKYPCSSVPQTDFLPFEVLAEGDELQF